MLTQVGHAVDAGIDVVQVRERELDAKALYELVLAMVALARESRTQIVVNDRLDVALAAGADGVHLRADSVAPADARRIAPSGFLIGRSVHSVDEALAHADAVDYLIAGTVWATPSKPPDSPLLGLDGLSRIATAVRIPVLAIGGATPDRFGQIVQARAAGAAAIGLFIRQPETPDTWECGATPLHDVVQRARAVVLAPPL